jgi:hypothetical protein
MQTRPLRLADGKTFRIGEGMSLQVRAEFFNPLNRTHMNDPPAISPARTQRRNVQDVPTSGFGRLDAGSVASSPRNGKLIARYRFRPDIVSHRSIK